MMTNCLVQKQDTKRLQFLGKRKECRYFIQTEAVTNLARSLPTDNTYQNFIG